MTTNEDSKRIKRGQPRRDRIGLAARLAMCDFKVPLTKEEQREQRAWDRLPPAGKEEI